MQRDSSQSSALPLSGDSGRDELVEEWRDAPYPGYRVSSLGRVMGVTGSLMAGVRLPSGYLQVTITSNRSPTGKQLKAYVHQMVCLAFHGPRPKGLEVRHLDGDNSNNRADNLCWGTRAENNEDKRQHGTISGWRTERETYGQTRVTKELASRIRDTYATGLLTQHQVAKAFGVSQSIVSRAARGVI
jgi:hypothetical protein